MERCVAGGQEFAAPLGDGVEVVQYQRGLFIDLPLGGLRGEAINATAAQQHEVADASIGSGSVKCIDDAAQIDVDNRRGGCPFLRQRGRERRAVNDLRHARVDHKPLERSAIGHVEQAVLNELLDRRQEAADFCIRRAEISGNDGDAGLCGQCADQVDAHKAQGARDENLHHDGSEQASNSANPIASVELRQIHGAPRLAAFDGGKAEGKGLQVIGAAAFQRRAVGQMGNEG